MTNSSKKLKSKKTLFLITLFAFPVLQYLVFWLYVNIQTIALSFQEFDYLTGSYKFVLFDNYVRLFNNILKDAVMLNAFKNSFHAIGINLITLPIAIMVSYTFIKKIPLERFFRVVFYLPSMVSTIVLVLCFKYMLSNNQNVFIGPLASLLNKIGVNFAGFDPVEHPNALWRLIYIYCIWAGLGTNVIMLSGAMSRIPKDISESASLDGIGFFRELICIYCPLSMNTISAFLLTTVMSVFSFYLVPMFITNGSIGVDGSMFTIPWYIFNGAQNGNSDELINVTTIGLMFSLIMFPVIVFVKWLTNKLTPDVSF